MAKKGKLLEQLVGAIQETVKDNPETIVQTNVKLKNDIGVKREIDVLVHNDAVCESFECKDYSNSKNRHPVDVQVIDGIIGKGKYLSQIDKFNIVSTTGYTSSAKKEAEPDNINLLTISKINKNDIYVSPTKIWQIQPKYKIEYPIIIAFYNGNQEVHTKQNYFPLIYDEETKQEVDIIGIIDQQIFNLLPDVANKFVDNDNLSHYKMNREIVLIPNRKCYLLDESNKCYFLIQICLNTYIEINFRMLNINEQSKLINENNNKQISTNSIYYPDNSDISIVNIESEDRQKFFYCKTSDKIIYEPPKKKLSGTKAK